MQTGWQLVQKVLDPISSSVILAVTGGIALVFGAMLALNKGTKTASEGAGSMASGCVKFVGGLAMLVGALLIAGAAVVLAYLALLHTQH
jgi:hypothetical protein